MSFSSNQKCYVDKTNASSNVCQDCGLPICGAHTLVQNRYVDRYSTDTSFLVCQNCFDNYEQKRKIRTPLMIIISILLVIVTFFVFSSSFGGFFPGLP